MRRPDAQMPLLEPEPLSPLPTDSTRYVAALQSQPGERDALHHVSADTWRRVTPLIHFVGPKTPPAAFKGETVRRWVARIADPIGKQPLYIDVTRLSPLHPVTTKDGEAPVLDYIFETSRNHGLRFVPVVWAGESNQDHHEIVRTAALHDGHGIALRYRLRKYVPPVGTSIEDYLDAELTALGLSVTEADLIVDLEFIDEDDELDPDGIAASLRQMTKVGAWRSIVLLGTSIPSMMSCVDEGTVGPVPRHEWELWSQLRRRNLERMPTFGDYVVQNPHPPHDGGGPGMRANIRYTTGDVTLVARGTGPFYEEGNAQYRDLCRKLTARAEFAGGDFSWGDRIIEECANSSDEPGGQRVWRGAGTSHHLRLVTRQLASLPQV